MLNKCPLYRIRRGIGAHMHAQVNPDLGVRVGMWYLERVHCNTGTVTPHQKGQRILHAEHSGRAPPQKMTVRSWYVLG